jgi:hypothetical protein
MVAACSPVAQREVAEQGVDRGEPVVAGGGPVVPLVFEMMQEIGDQRRVEVGDVQLAGLFAGLLGSEAEQQTEGELVAAMVLGPAARWRMSRSVNHACSAGARALIGLLRRTRRRRRHLRRRTSDRRVPHLNRRRLECRGWG